jgi:NAD(P)-dependent dehydrogenase (short-subunit alcohol dehydrogenase family)
MSLQAKTILITGTSSGFGRDAAETLASQGHTVVATMRDINGKNKASADALRQLAQERGWSIHIVELDVTSDSSVEQAISVIKSQTASIDVLINNAGYFVSGISEAFTPQQVEAQFATNVFGVHRMMRAVLPTMRQQRSGLIINISSVLGRVTMPFVGIYGATKFAVEAISDSFRYEVSPFGIDVAIIQPSAYPTDIFHKVVTPADQERIASYGDVANEPGKMFEVMNTKILGGDIPPNPHEVVEAMVNLVNQPQGQRRDRTIVGNDFGAQHLNDVTAPVQAGVVQFLGMSHLDKTPALAGV